MVLFCSLPLLSQSSLNTTLEGRWAIGHCLAADASGSLVYYANGGFLIIADVSDPANPVEVGKIAVPARIYGMAVSGNFAYLADAFEGLQIIDLSDPANPAEIGFWDTNGTALSVAVSGNTAYVADGNQGLRIIDVSNPAMPQEVGFFDPLLGNSSYVTVSGNYAYVA
ncbi:MAG: hypothetical protein KDG51_11595, partial [Calditrichaeota bacterium]|nr:hypothetical protein [Calditrichota bacterium]